MLYASILFTAWRHEKDLEKYCTTKNFRIESKKFQDNSKSSKFHDRIKKLNDN